MKKPKLDKITDLFKSGQDFELSRSEYIKLTGADIPQSKSYTEKRSAVAKRANEYGYSLEIVPEIIAFKKK